MAMVVPSSYHRRRRRRRQLEPLHPVRWQSIQRRRRYVYKYKLERLLEFEEPSSKFRFNIQLYVNQIRINLEHCSHVVLYDVSSALFYAFFSLSFSLSFPSYKS